MGLPPSYSAYQLIITFGLLIVVITLDGGSGILAASTINSLEKRLKPTEFRDYTLNL
jgi:hypothetical protein